MMGEATEFRASSDATVGRFIGALFPAPMGVPVFFAQKKTITGWVGLMAVFVALTLCSVWLVWAVWRRVVRRVEIGPDRVAITGMRSQSEILYADIQDCTLLGTRNNAAVCVHTFDGAEHVVRAVGFTVAQLQRMHGEIVGRAKAAQDEP